LHQVLVPIPISYNIAHAERNEDQHVQAVVFVYRQVDAAWPTILRVSKELQLTGNRKAFENQQCKYQYEIPGSHTVASGYTEPMRTASRFNPSTKRRVPIDPH